MRGVGALAADAVAQAAELLVALTRHAGLAEPQGRAARIHARASALSVSNELAFTRALREQESASASREPSRAQSGAVEVPLAICQEASELVQLAATLASGPLTRRSADLCGIAQLAAGACDTAALLVRAYAVIPRDDERRDRAEQISAAARAAAQRVRAELVPT